MAVILLSKCKHFTFPCSQFLMLSFWFGHCISAGTGVSLSAWTKALQGRETNFREHGETIRPALFNAHARSGRHFATWGEFLLSTSSCNHRYRLHFAFYVKWPPSRLSIIFLFAIRLIL